MREMCKECLCPNCEHFDFDCDGACELCGSDKSDCSDGCPDYLSFEGSEKGADEVYAESNN